MARCGLAGALLLLLAAAAGGRVCLAITQEDTSLDNLGPHDGMIFFDGALRKTVPPGAPAGGPAAVAASAVPCKCSDAAPRNTEADAPVVGIDCYHQRTVGSCNADYMKTFLKELVFTDGFCMISCGRCPCCAPPADVLKKLGATRFLQAAQAATPPLNDSLAHPGFTATLLVPTDAALEAALTAHPGVMQDPVLLQQVLKFHVLPPEPARRGLWTSPLLSVGAKLYTQYDGNATLQVPKFPLPAGTNAYGGLKDFTIQGPVNSAKVVASDIATCKGYITVIDSVLFPFDPKDSKVANGGGGAALGAALGAPNATLQANALVTGQMLKDGGANRQRTVAACAASCAAAPPCNAFRYCALKGGCKTADGSSFKFGECTLQRSAEVSAGQPAHYDDFGADVPWVSGSLAPAGGAAPAPVAAAGRRLRRSG